jgi:hypothetical protein
MTPGSSVRRFLQLLAAGCALSWCVNLRYPDETPAHNWVLPSADIAVMLALLTLFAPQAPATASRRWLRLSCGLLLCVRLGRIADGVCQRYFDRQFHVVADLPLLPELARLALSTLGPLYFGLALLALISSIALCWWLLRLSVDQLARALSERRYGDRFLIAAGTLALLGPWLAPQGSFYASSVAPRLLGELEQWLTSRGWQDDPERAAQREDFAQRFAAGQQQLMAAASHLSQGSSVDVHLVLVEAYGRTVQTTPFYSERLAPSYQAFERQVAAAGFAVCSDFVRATTLGGNSWLTHATLQTGVAISDQFAYGTLMERTKIESLAKSFGAAGYRTVSVKPGTTRKSMTPQLYGFDREYAAQDLDYHGPAYAWAPMPDQFVLQRVAEHELRAPAKPLFVEYALVSSHFPFNPRPPYVEDWSSLGDGSLFERLPPLAYDPTEHGLFAQVLGYADALSYDLRVLGTFLSEHVRGDALVIILGDHQPIAPIAGEDRSRFTPLHVLSRRSALLEPFRARGCLPGMTGRSSEPQLAMESLGVDLLHVLSSQASVK